MPLRLLAHRRLRVLLSALAATAISCGTLIPLTAAPAHAVSPIHGLIIHAGDGQVEVGWEDDNAGTYPQYRVDCTPVDEGDPASVVWDFGLGASLVTALTNFEPYTCTVTGLDGNGDDATETSEPSEEFTPGRPPNAPTLDSVVVNGSGSVAVSITPDPLDNAPVTNFAAACLSEEENTAPQFGSGATSPVTVSGLSVGATYYCLANAGNEFGDSNVTDPSEPFLVATTPDTPTIGGVTPGDMQVSVAFTAGASDGGSPVLEYTATCTPVDVGAPMGQNGANSPINVTGLTNDEAYTCTVHATNLAGNSDESDASASVTPTSDPPPDDPPDAPTNVVISNIGSRNIQVDFDEPNDNGSPITNYTTTCDSSDGGEPASGSGAATGFFAGIATPLKHYTCTVTATNDGGEGPASDASNELQVNATAPDNTDVDSIARGDGKLAIFFTPPFDGGSPITNYRAECDSADDPNSPIQQSSLTSPIVVTGLLNDVDYTCFINTDNAIGQASGTPFSAVQAHDVVPAAPTITGTARGDGSVSIFIDPGFQLGSDVTEYQVLCSSSDGGAPASDFTNGSPVTVSGLTLGKTYTCIAWLVNVVGAGATSAASGSFTAAGVPDAPPKPTIESRAAAVRVTLSAPDDNFEPITGYTAECSSSNGGAPGSQAGAVSPITVGALTNGKTYTCVVRATNDIGTSSNSAASDPVVPGPAPDPPETVIAAANGENRIRVAFTPAPTGPIALSFTATCTSNDGGTTRTGSDSASPVFVPNLTNNRHYTCTVVATNMSGDSVASDPTDPVLAIQAPVKPDAPTATGGPGFIDVAFDYTPADGAPTDVYDASCWLDGGDPEDGTGESGVSSPVRVNGLAPGDYVCTITAVSYVGMTASDPSDPTTVSVVVSAPDPPDNIVVTPSGTQASIAFNPPGFDGNDPITSYTATCTSSNGGTTRSASDTDSPVVVLNLSNGKTYTCNMYSTNSFDDSPTSFDSDPFDIDSTEPGAPAEPTVTQQNGQLEVAFSAPDNGGSAITSYTATCTSSNGGTTGFEDGTSSPLVVDELDNGYTYSCTVKATNVHGDSDLSPDSDSAIPNVNAGAPGIVSKPTTSRGNGSLSVEFVAPAAGDSAIISYTATCTDEDDNGFNATDSGSPVVVTALENGTEYTCTVFATNSFGDGEPSVASDATVAASVPSLPAAPTVEVTAFDTIKVTYTEPDDNGDPFINFAARCISSDGGDSGSQSGMTSPIEVDELSPGHTYACDMLAYNSIGGSGFGADSDPIVIPAIAPDPPGSVAAGADLDTGAIHVTFVEPYDGGATITAYHVTCASSNGGATVTADGASSPIEVTGGTPGKFYSCTATAENSAGTGGESDVSNSMTVNAKPGAPANVDVTRGDNSAAVLFTYPTNDGTPITLFTVTCTSSDGGATIVGGGTASPTIVSGLWHGFTYTCAVNAENDAGIGPESDPSDPFVVISTPGAPSVLGVIIDGTKGTVSFLAPSDDGGDTVDEYNGTCASSDGGETRSATGSSLSGSPMQIDVTGLSKGHLYTCHVAAQNEAGYGPDSSDTIQVWVLPTAPGAPTDLEVTNTTTGTSTDVALSWTAPDDDGGQTISTYTATCTSNDGGATVTDDTTDIDIDLTEFTAGKTYTCSVTATNTVNTGAASDVSDPFVPNAVPGTPTLGAVTRVNSSTVTVAFTPGTNNGTDVTQYWVDCSGGNGAALASGNGPSSPITVSSMDVGYPYVCDVYAQNAAGFSDSSHISPEFWTGTAPQPTNSVSVTGTLIAQRTLTGHGGAWTGTPMPSVTRRWQRCNANLAGCTNISGATGASYTLTNADVDKRIKFIETAANGVGNGTLTTTTAVVKTVPVATSGGYYYVNGHAAQKPPRGVVGAASHGNTVWLVNSVGNLSGKHFGPGNGTLVGKHLNKPIIGVVATPSGLGYWMFASDGGIFSFGDARFYGSTGGKRLNAPIVSMTATPTGRGYWLFAADGGVFTFGDAHFYGSTGSMRLAYPVVAMMATPSGHGYWLVTRDGRAIRFGDATNIGGAPGHRDIVGLVSTGSGYRFITTSGQFVVPR